ncbi:MAG: LLM class flavin-dependent oxidoreductase [Betaproteobacteria bacterium]|nr:LLM class flavin-dependent oxidoreductase [Betaproteobacteria bacterium]
MRFGLFGGAQANAAAGGTSNHAAASGPQNHAAASGIEGQGFHDYIEFNVEADALGYHSTFCVEHHFTGWAQISATLNLLTWLAARAKNIRVGTAVMVLPWHNPVLLAEQAATLDLLSGGRLDLGIGKGYRYTEFTGFCVPESEAEARFDEALEVMVKAWTTRQRFSHRGKFWQFENIIVEPPSAQKPHPALWMAAGSAASIRKVAERGCNLLLDQYALPDVIAERIALYKSEVQARGRVFDPMSVALARDVYIARDAADKQAALERNARQRQRIIEVALAPGKSGGSHVLAYQDSATGNEAAALYGSPDEIARKLEALRAAGVHYVLASMGGGARDTLRRFAKEIAPAFAAA